MSSLPIATNWTKTPGPNFVGGPDGRIIDLEDWRVMVRANLSLSAVVELTRFEAGNPECFKRAEDKCVAMIEKKVYGPAVEKLEQLRRDIEFTGDENLIRQVEAIIAMIRPREIS